MTIETTTAERARGKQETRGPADGEGLMRRLDELVNGGDRVNVGTLERWGSLVGGGFLVARGLTRGGTGGLLGAALGAKLAHRGVTGYCHVYDALDVSTADEEAEEHGASGLLGGTREVRVEAVASVDRPAAELYRFWHDPTNLPRFMSLLEAVELEAEGRARWTLRPPKGPALEFVAEVTADEEDRRIAWRSEETSVVEHTGEVAFREMPHGRGTAVRLLLVFTPPGGAVGAGLARLFDGATEMALRMDLKRFKQLMETGEVATTEGQPAARWEGRESPRATFERVEEAL